MAAPFLLPSVGCQHVLFREGSSQKKAQHAFFTKDYACSVVPLALSSRFACGRSGWTSRSTRGINRPKALRERDTGAKIIANHSHTINFANDSQTRSTRVWARRRAGGGPGGTRGAHIKEDPAEPADAPSSDLEGGGEMGEEEAHPLGDEPASDSAQQVAGTRDGGPGKAGELGVASPPTTAAPADTSQAPAHAERDQEAESRRRTDEGEPSTEADVDSSTHSRQSRQPGRGSRFEGKPEPAPPPIGRYGAEEGLREDAGEGEGEGEAEEAEGEAVPEPQDPYRELKVLVAGANGRTGRAVVDALVAKGVPVRALVRDRRAAADVGRRAGVELVEGDVYKYETVKRALGDSNAIICATGASPNLWDPLGPYKVDFIGTTNLVAAAKNSGSVNKFVFVTSLGTGQLLNPFNIFFGILFWKRQAEIFLQQSGLPYTVIRPGGLLAAKDKRGHLVTGPADTFMGGAVRRAQVADLCVAALVHAEATDKIVEVVARENASNRSFAELFMAS